MTKRNLRVATWAALAVGGVLSAASPAWANHTGFTQGEYEVREDAPYVELTVGSSCCPTGSGQFDYHTADLSAVAGTDYQQTSGTVTTAACIPCTIRVRILDDDLFEGEEQFEVRLTNFRGTFAQDRTTAVVRILDDDLKPPAGSSSPGRSSGQTAGSSGGSSARPPSPQSAASRAADADNQSAGVTTPIPGSPGDQDDVALRDETDAQDPAVPLGRQAEQGRSDRSSLVLAALAVLLVVAGASFGILRRNSG